LCSPLNPNSLARSASSVLRVIVAAIMTPKCGTGLSGRAFALAVMLVTLLGIAASYVALNRGFGGAVLVARTVNCFSFFTVLSNVLVVLASRAAVFRDGPGSEEVFFDRCRTRTAIALYVFVVGAVYSLVLRSLWHPKKKDSSVSATCCCMTSPRRSFSSIGGSS
jgi:hypothetical protein